MQSKARPILLDLASSIFNDRPALNMAIATNSILGISDRLSKKGAIACRIYNK